MNIFNIVLTSIITSTISVRWALKKYRSEKWWDKKLESYLQTVEAMNKIINYCDKYIAENCCGKEFSEEEMEQLNTDFSEGKKLLEKQINIGNLMLTKQAHRKILQLDRFLYEFDLDRDLKQVGGLRDETDDCLSSFIELAKADLGMKEKWGLLPISSNFSLRL